VKKLEIVCCFVFCDEADNGGLLFGAIGKWRNSGEVEVWFWVPKVGANA
jgi:hypothetical protein